MRRPTLHQLEIFCRVVEQGSMARVAEEMRVTSSSVSMQLQGLEKRYRTRLLVRTQHGTSPTAAGTALYEGIVALLHGLDTVETQISGIASTERSTLRFSVSRTIGAAAVRPVLPTFESEHPEVPVSYSVASNSKAAVQDLIEERVEFALVGRTFEDPRLVSTPLFVDPLVVAVAPHHELAAVGAVAITDLSCDAVMVRQLPVLGSDRIEGVLTEAGLGGSIREMGSTEKIKADAVAGRGIAVLTQSSIVDELASGTLQICDVAGLSGSRTIHVVHLERAPWSPVAQIFLTLVRKNLARAGVASVA